MDHLRFHQPSWNRSDLGLGLGIRSPLDAVVVILYLVLVLILGLWVVLTHNRATIKDFFLAGRNLNWWLIGTSLFSASIGSGHFMGLAVVGATSGIAFGAFEWNTIFMLFILGWIFVPIYARAGVVTLPEYMRKRFGSVRIQLLLSFLFLLIYILSKISLDLCLGAMFLKVVWDIDIYQTVLVLLIISGMYTITGGIIAVVYTEALQAGIMILGSALLTIFAFNKVGGYQELVNKYFQAIPSRIHEGNWTAKAECYMPHPDAFHIFRDPISGDIPWPGLIFGATSVFLFYACADQVSLLRFLAGKSMSHVRAGCLLGGFLKLLPMFVMVMPGMISRTLFPDQVACVVPSECQKYCGNPTSCSLLAYPMLVMALMPTGLQGFILSMLCAAIMSSLTSVFNSTSALFTMNIYACIRRTATEKELMVAGRFFVIILLSTTIAWIPAMEIFHSGKMFEHMHVVRSFLTTPISAVFLLAVFCTRVNEQGAFWGLTLGISIGFFRLVAELVYGPWTCEESSKCPVFICGLHYLYFNILLLAVTLLTILGISLATDPIPVKHLLGLCWSLRNSQEKRLPLEPEIEWKTLSSRVSYSDNFREDSGLLWKYWDLFCGLDPWPGERLSPEKVTKKATKEQTLDTDTLGNAEVSASREATRKMEMTKKTKWGNMPENPYWQRVMIVVAIFLFVLVVVGHIYYA